MNSQNLLYLTGIELTKLRRSKILFILLVPVIIMWVPGIINAEINFTTQGVLITPEKNFFIQGFMGMAWFMIPASLIICTVLLIQTERGHGGMLKMLSLLVNVPKLCLAKFMVLILLAAAQMIMSIGTYYLSAAAATQMQNYDFILDPMYVIPCAVQVYAGAIPMAAVFWMAAILIQTPVFSIGTGLASIVPCVLIINTKFWYVYPMSYPFYLLMVEYGKAAKGIFETEILWFPWLPAAVFITAVSLAVSCLKFGAYERR